MNNPSKTPLLDRVRTPADLGNLSTEQLKQLAGELRLKECLAVAEGLAALGVLPTVADARFAKPLDAALVERLAREHEVLVTVEEGAAGGFGSVVMQHLAWRGLLDSGLKVRPMTLPDRLIDHDSQPRQCDQAGLNAPQIVATVLGALDRRHTQRKSTLVSTS